MPKLKSKKTGKTIKLKRKVKPTKRKIKRRNYRRFA